MSSQWSSLGVGVGSVLDTTVIKRQIPSQPPTPTPSVTSVTIGNADVIMILIPDAHGIDAVRSLVANLEQRLLLTVETEDVEREAQDVSIVMFNPSVVSSEVGVGLRSRSIMKELVNEWETVYCLKPNDRGAVFRSYPMSWKVFLEDEDAVGRYCLLGEQLSRPNSDRIEQWLYERFERDNRKNDNDDDSNGDGMMMDVVGAFRAMQRFMRTLSN